MKFKFSLASVKKVFEQRQKEVQREMSRKLKEKRIAENEVKKVLGVGKGLRAELEPGKEMPAVKIQSFSEMLDQNDRRLSVLEKKLSDLDQICEQKRNLLLEVNRRKSALEKLEEKQRETFKTYQARKEQKQLDDICSLLKQGKMQ